MEIQKFESMKDSIDNSIVFEEPALQPASPTSGLKPTEFLPPKGWDTMQRRGAHVFDNRDAEKLLNPKLHSKRSLPAQGKKAQFWASFKHLGILDYGAITVAVVLLLVFFNECASALAYSDSMKLGVKALDDNDARLASKFFSAGISASPESSYAHYLRAVCEISDNSTDEAVKDLDRAIYLDHKNLNALLTRAALMMKQDRYHDAVKNCSAVLAFHPSDIDALRLRASAYLHERLYEKSIDDSTSALKLLAAKDESRVDLLSVRGFSYDQEHKYLAAIKDYSEGIKLDPKNEKLFLGRAISRMHAKQWSNAAADCSASIALNASVAAAYKVRAYCREKLRMQTLALADLDKLIALHSTVDTRKLRGNMRLQAKDLLGALQDFDHVLEIDPNDAVTAAKYKRAKDILQSRVNGRVQRVVEAPAKRDIVPTINLASSSDSELLNKGYELLMNGKATESIAYLQVCVRNNPNNAKARRFLAFAFLQSGRAGLAAEQFAAQASLGTLKRTDSLAFASALAKSGLPADALNIYSNLISENGKDDYARVAAIKLLLKSGERDEARSLALEGMQASPEYRRIYRALSAN